MNSITYKNFSKIMNKMAKENNVKKSNVAMSARVSGWGNQDEGYEYYKPRFDFSYVRNYRRIKNISNNAFETMKVEYTSGTRNIKDGFQDRLARFNELFMQNIPSDVYEINRDGSFEVRITNELL
jgi:hypothetical protein